ncbi:MULTISPECIES: hypothetical protein [Cryobacterium]|uniref:Uncharacterized protein n=1 Tax=Cryobacterium breve TaxID=1259258 RepID=A0ABY2J2Q1_9MICO|nr:MULTISPECIES: hypothetical protein [Cryobacterium]TFC90899.1 hypothetical protein E3T20_14800 [Cryobacterium sp. TmT3-12]TFC99218.1 hypothetical protein E3O65_05935 [Cryobacterium breve]
MTITDVQADVRRAYRGGFSGPLISAIVWAVANTIYLLVSPGAAMAALFFGGMLIFPLSAVILKTMPGRSSLPKGHASSALAMQSAFTVPVGLLVAIALGTYEPVLFFPASLLIVGAHYFVFVTLYGTKTFALLGGALVVLGAIGMYFVPAIGAVSGWIGGAVFLAFTPFLFGKAQGDWARQ